MAKSFLNQAAYPRGLRNNNPGNLIRTSDAWQGKIPFSQSKDTKFEQFYELRYGVRALMININSQFKKGINTVREIITKYAPPHENNTEQYIIGVCQALGVGDSEALVLTEEILMALCKAIVKIEIGASYAQFITR